MRYWHPGQQLTEKDRTMLEETVSFYQENGYTPSKNEISNMAELKSRFRTWSNVLLAAGLPDRNAPDNQRKRMEAVKLKREKAE